MTRAGALGAFLLALVSRGLLVENRTPSEPLGTYLLIPALAVRYGDRVLACEPTAAQRFARDHHFAAIGSSLPIYGCPNRALLIKEVWGLPGDRMTVGLDGVRRNGELLDSSAPAVRLHDGTPLPIASSTVVRPGTIWAGSRVAHSWDSRYYGPVHVIARAVLVWAR